MPSEGEGDSSLIRTLTYNQYDTVSLTWEGMAPLKGKYRHGHIFSVAAHLGVVPHHPHGKTVWVLTLAPGGTRSNGSIQMVLEPGAFTT